GYVIVGVAQLALALAFVATRRLWPASGDEAHADAPRAPLGATLRLPAMLLSAGVFVLYCGLEASTGAWLFTLLHEGRAVATGTAGIAVSIFWGSLMAARIVFGLAHVRGPLSSWLLGCMSAIIVAALVLAVSTHAVMS